MADRLPNHHPLRRLFRRTLERAFRGHRDVWAPDVAMHLEDNVLSGFVHSDRLYRLRTLQGRRLRELTEMLRLARMEDEGPERRLEVDGYIGDYVLFMGGFFPSALRRGAWLTGDAMVTKVGGLFVKFSRPYDYFIAEARNAYQRAARTARVFDPGTQATYTRLGGHLEQYLDVLSCVRRLLRHERTIELDPDGGDEGEPESDSP